MSSKNLINSTDRIKNLSEIILTHYKNPAVYLVGSYASGTQTQGSDIDLLVFIDSSKEKKDLLRLRNTIEPQFTIIHYYESPFPFSLICTVIKVVRYEKNT